jgi:hypothetical protein
MGDRQASQRSVCQGGEEEAATLKPYTCVYSRHLCVHACGSCAAQPCGNLCTVVECCGGSGDHAATPVVAAWRLADALCTTIMQVIHCGVLRNVCWCEPPSTLQGVACDRCVNLVTPGHPCLHLVSPVCKPQSYHGSVTARQGERRQSGCRSSTA